MRLGQLERQPAVGDDLVPVLHHIGLRHRRDGCQVRARHSVDIDAGETLSVPRRLRLRRAQQCPQALVAKLVKPFQRPGETLGLGRKPISERSQMSLTIRVELAHRLAEASREPSSARSMSIAPAVRATDRSFRRLDSAHPASGPQTREEPARYATEGASGRKSFREGHAETSENVMGRSFRKSDSAADPARLRHACPPARSNTQRPTESKQCLIWSARG